MDIVFLAASYSKPSKVALQHERETEMSKQVCKVIRSADLDSIRGTTGYHNIPATSRINQLKCQGKKDRPLSLIWSWWDLMQMLTPTVSHPLWQIDLEENTPTYGNIHHSMLHRERRFCGHIQGDDIAISRIAAIVELLLCCGLYCDNVGSIVHLFRLHAFSKGDSSNSRCLLRALP